VLDTSVLSVNIRVTDPAFQRPDRNRDRNRIWQWLASL